MSTATIQFKARFICAQHRIFNKDGKEYPYTMVRLGNDEGREFSYSTVKDCPTNFEPYSEVLVTLDVNYFFKRFKVAMIEVV